MSILVHICFFQLLPILSYGRFGPVKEGNLTHSLTHPMLFPSNYLLELFLSTIGVFVRLQSPATDDVHPRDFATHPTGQLILRHVSGYFFELKVIPSAV